MVDQEPLATLDRWTAIPDAERAAILTALARACGDPWRAGRVRVGRHGLGALVHAGIDQEFVVVPGGWLRMGFSVDDIFLGANLREKREETSPWTHIDQARPTRWVRIRTFLLAIDGLPPEADGPRTDGGAASEAYREAVKAARGDDDADAADAADEDDEADEAEEADEDSEDGESRGARLVPLDELPAVIAAIPAGLRLPTEAELEWVLREGGTTRWIGVAGDTELTAKNRNAVLLGDLDNGFGITSFRDIQNPCADGGGWYGGVSPADQGALNTDAEARIGRWAHTYWQWDDGEMMGMHAAARAVLDEYGDTIVRLAADLPLAAEPLGAPPGALAEHALTLEALAGDDALARNDALAALGHLATGPGHDAAGTAGAVIALLPKLAPPLRARMLRWLADVQVAGHSEETVQPPERKRPEWLPDRAEARAAVATAAPVLIAHLDDADPDVRSAAALALAFSPGAPAAAALTARLAHETVTGVRCGLVLALARLGAPLPVTGDAGPELAAALAIGTAYDGAPDLDALVAATALDTVPHLAYDGGQLGNVATGLLRRIGTPQARRRAAPNIAARAVREHSTGLAGAAIEIAFGEDHAAGAPWAADQLSPEQRRVIETLIAREDELPWHAHGLPPTPSGRRRLLGLSPPGPTDRVVDHGGVPRTLAFVLRDLQLRPAPGADDDDEDAPTAVSAFLAALDPATRLALYLDRDAHGLTTGVRLADGGWAWEPLRGWRLKDLLAAIGDDRIAARAAVDAFVALADRPRGGADLIAAVIGTRAPGEPVDPALLAELDDTELGQDPALLQAFPRAAVEARLLGALRSRLAAALASDSWTIGADTDVERWAGALAAAPSAQAVRWMLLLGWASGQPASVREAIAAHAAAPEIAAVLAEYDAYPEYTSWPKARAGLADLMGERPALGSR